MKTDFHFADVGTIKPHESSLNLGESAPRYLVMRKLGGIESVVLDFVSDWNTAQAIAAKMNLATC